MDEHKSQFENHFSHQSVINYDMRTALIDWLFEIGTKRDSQDKTIILNAIYLCDCYYANPNNNKPSRDYALTATVSLFIASKNLEVEPIYLDNALNHILGYQYAKQSFLEKETEIRNLVNQELEAPSTLDFFMLYLKLIKFEFQDFGPISLKMANFLTDIQTICWDLCKGAIVDAQLLKYKPSILAMAFIKLAFEL